MVKKDYLPSSVLARSDANLARTRSKFLNQYEILNDHKAQNLKPSYKFALSSTVIDKVDTVVRNNSERKDYLMKHVQSQQEMLLRPYQDRKQRLNLSGWNDNDDQHTVIH